MRALIWVLALAAAAVGLALAARYDAGYVLIVVHPYRVELSLNLLVLLLAVGFIFGYLLTRVAAHTLRLPDTVRKLQEQRRHDKARSALFDALRAFFEGRFGRAEQAAARSLELGEYPALSAVIAARAAHELKGFSRRDAYLAASATFGRDEAAMLLVTQAELLLDERRAREALDALGTLPEKHTAAMRLELKAQQMAKNWERVLELAAQLLKRGVFDAAQARQLARYAHAENLKRKALDANELEQCWQRIAASERRDAKIAAAAAQCFMALGGCARAHEIIEDGLDANWDTELIGLYAECLGPDTLKQIERAETWLKSQPKDAVLLLTLGRLCAHMQLWGKAQSYLEASLSVEPSFSAHMALAQLLEGIDREEAAREQYRASLELALAQLRSSSGGRRRTVL